MKLSFEVEPEVKYLTFQKGLSLYTKCGEIQIFNRIIDVLSNNEQIKLMTVKVKAIVI